MKRAERQHLKGNELHAFARQASDAFDAYKREATWLLAIAAVVAAAAVGYFARRESVQTKADALLAQAVAVQTARIAPPPAPGQP